MQLEVWPGVVCFILVMSGFNGVREEDSGFAEGKENELDGGAIRDGLTALGGNGSDNLYIFPKVLHVIVWIPGLGKLVLVGFKIRCS
jgi:hypothetical protein